MPTAYNNGCAIAFETAGDGPPVVMVYGIAGSSRRWWSGFLEPLAARYRLILVDNRGTGFSDRPEGAWSMAEMTGDVAAVVDALSLDSFHLLGCSLGTLIARHFVAQHGGSRVRSLSLLCPPNGIPATEEDLRLALFWDREAGLTDQARASWPVVHPSEWAAANDALLLADFEASLAESTPMRTIQYQFAAAMTAGDPTPALNEHRWPVLVAHGTGDRLVPPENARTLVASVPRARLEWVEGGGHNLWQHAPDTLSRIVLEFLDDAEATR